MKEHMRKSWKNMIVYGMALCFLLITVVIPRQAVQAKDSGDGWGSNQIVEFKGKNATWNLCADQVYNIKTGNRSNVWRKVSLKSSNKAVVKTMNCYGSNGNWFRSYWICGIMKRTLPKQRNLQYQWKEMLLLLYKTKRLERTADIE